MIKPIKNSIHFGSMEDYKKSIKQGSSYKSTPLHTSVPQAFQKTPEKVSFKQRVLNIFKNFNKVTGTASGAARGVVDGAILAAGIGFVGRNLKNAKGHIGKTITGMFKDAGKIIKSVIEHKPISSILTKSPIENLKTLKSVPNVFYNKCMKGNKLTSIAVVTAAVGAIAFRTIQGKLIANKKNADLDHYTNNKH